MPHAATPAGSVPVGSLHASSIVNTVRQPLMLLDEEACVVLANPAFYRVFRVDEAHTVGHSLFSLGAGQWDVPELRALWRALAEERRVIEDFELTHDFPALGLRVFHLSARPLEHVGAAGAGGAAPTLFLVAFEDVTARHGLEAARARHLREVERSNLELEQFAYVASHDLQEPLRKIRAYGDLLLAEHAAQLDEEGREFLQRMVRAGARMSALIADLLALSRVATAGRPPVPTDMDRVLDEVLSDLEVVLRESGATIERSPLPTVRADPMQMRQLLQNLVSNALKFRRLDVAPRITIGARRDGDREVFTVTDNGIGFESRHADLIFAPFQRLHGRDAYAGTGMGLTICRRIVERHGGTIHASAVPGSGATFTFTLPPADSPT